MAMIPGWVHQRALASLHPRTPGQKVRRRKYGRWVIGESERCRTYGYGQFSSLSTSINLALDLVLTSGDSHRSRVRMSPADGPS